MYTKCKVAIMLLFAFNVFAAVGQQKLASRTATSSFSLEQTKDGVRSVTVNTRFRADHQDARWIVYEERFTTRETGGNCCFTTLATTAYKVTTSSQTPLWKLEATADEAIDDFPFYRTLLGGCCGGSDTYTYYDPENGARVYESSFEILKVEVPNTHPQLRRYIAAHEDAETWNITLQYGDEKHATKRYVVQLPSNPDLGPWRLGDIELRSDQDKQHNKEVTLWNANGRAEAKSFSGFEIVLKYIDEQPITIPVENDELQMDRATFPKGTKILDQSDTKKAVATR